MTNDNEQTSQTYTSALNDAVALWQRVITDHAALWTEMLDTASSGSFKADDVASFAGRWWSQIAGDVEQAWSVGYQRARSGGSTPVVAFVVDAASESADPKDVFLNVVLDRDAGAAKIAVTDLRQLGGTAAVSGRIDANPTARGTALSVGLQRLQAGTDADGNAYPALGAGHWGALVYVDDSQNKIPLAVVHVQRLAP